MQASNPESAESHAKVDRNPDQASITPYILNHAHPVGILTFCMSLARVILHLDVLHGHVLLHKLLVV